VGCGQLGGRALGPAGVSVRLADPLLLLLLAPLAVLAALVGRRGQRQHPARWGRWSAAQGLAAVLVGLALAQPQLGIGSRPAVVLALDRSASVDGAMRSAELGWVRQVRSACPHPCRIVQFAASAEVLPPSRSALAAHPPGGTAKGSTDLARGVRTAVALAPQGGRVVVLGDGVDTAGDVSTAAALARARHVSVDFAPLTDRHLRDAAITQVLAPNVVRSGDLIPVLVTVRSTVSGAATLSVQRDGGSVESQTIRLGVGDTPLLLDYTAGLPGWASFSVKVALPADRVPQNDGLSAATRVLAPPRVLAVGASRPPPATLARMLTRLGLRVGRTAAAGLPSRAAGFAGIDTVLLDDVPAAALAPSQVAALAAAVRAGGLGLVVLGGPHSFSLGGYAHSALESVLPVSSLVPGNRQRRNVAIELVLDHSGSMVDLAGGVPKIAMVRVAGSQTAEFVAAHQDQLGVVDFDVRAHVLVPLERVTRGAVERRAIGAVTGLQAGGGTDIVAGLRAGAQQLEQSRAPRRRLILMTDGISEPGNLGPLLQSLRRHHIAVTTVALGKGADRTLLARIAAATGGHAYATADARQLPRIFAKETRLDVKPVRVDGAVTVRPASDSPVVRSLAGRPIPGLRGNVVTTLQGGAEADLVAQGPGGGHDPALAQWQVGLGRVVAWTPGLGPPWAGAWSNETSMWNDVVRWADRAPSPAPLALSAIPGSPPTLQVDLSGEGAAARAVTAVTGALTSAGGVIHPIRLAEVQPSLFRAALPRVPPGVYRFRLAAAAAHGPRATGVIAIPYRDEYLPRPARDTPVYQLVARTGGRVLAAGDPGVLTRGGWLGLWWWLALGALALVLVSWFGRLLRRPAGPAAAGPA